MAEKKYCEFCEEEKSINSFYKSNNLEEYPDGYLNTCRKCLTKYCNLKLPKSYMPIFEMVDVPFISEEWRKCLISYEKGEGDAQGIVGKYIAKMQFKMYRDYRWKDTMNLKAAKKEKIKKTLEDQNIDPELIRKQLEAFEKDYEYFDNKK